MTASWYLTQTISFTGRRQRLDAQGRPVTDRYGNDVYDTVPFDVPNCSWEPRTSVFSENVEARQQVTSGVVVFCADPDVDVRPTDAATIDGVEYEVEGEVARYRGSRMGNDHAMITLRRVAG